MHDPDLQLPKLHFITYYFTPAMVKEYGYDVKPEPLAVDSVCVLASVLASVYWHQY